MNSKYVGIHFSIGKKKSIYLSFFYFSLLTSASPAHAFLRNFAAQISRATQGLESEVRRVVETLPADTQRDLEEAAKKAREAAEKMIADASPRVDELAADVEPIVSAATAAAADSPADATILGERIATAWSQVERDNPEAAARATRFVENLAARLEASWTRMETENPGLRQLRDLHFATQTYITYYQYPAQTQNTTTAYIFTPNPEAPLLSFAHRSEARNRIIEIFSSPTFHGTYAGETIMRRDVIVAFLRSVQRLEERYPHAIGNAASNFQAMQTYIENMDASLLGTEGENKKRAALRCLSRFRYQNTFVSEWTVALDQSDAIRADYNQNRLLNLVELSSLTWEAAHDPEVFSAPEVALNEAAIVAALARSQRAHNDQEGHSAGQMGGAINYSPTIPDSPSCSMGTTIRTLEPLDFVHPDVQIQPHVETIIPPTPAEVSREQLAFARALRFDEGTVAERLAREDYYSTDEFARTREALANHLRQIFPGILPHQIECATESSIVLEVLGFASESE